MWNVKYYNKLMMGYNLTAGVVFCLKKKHNKLLFYVESLAVVYHFINECSVSFHESNVKIVYGISAMYQNLTLLSFDC